MGVLGSRLIYLASAHKCVCMHNALCVAKSMGFPLAIDLQQSRPFVHDK